MKYAHIFTLVLTGLALLAGGLHAQSVSDAQRTVQRDLDNALQEYAKLQEEIRNAKVPLSRQLNRLEREAREKERELRDVRRRRDASQSTLIELNNRRETLQTNIGYMENLLNDFNRRFEATINVAEKQLYQELIEVVKENTQDTDRQLSHGDIFEAQAEVVGAAFDRVVAAIGGRKFEGNAIVPGGDSVSGNFVVFGPAAYFASPDGVHAGLVDRRSPVRARILTIGFEPAIAQVAQTGSGFLPFDATLNDAVEIALHRTTFRDEIAAGGVWIWPIVAFFILSMLTGVYKFFSIFTVSRPDESVLQEILDLVNAGKKEEAMQKAQALKGPFGKLLEDAVTFSGDSKELLEEVLYERMLETQPKLESLLPFIAVTAATAPLLGLLGTVTGMINTFEQITLFGTSDASKLAGGISEALVTTKYGLITAIPALIFHALLARRAQGVMATMEKYSAAFVNGLSNGKSVK